MFHSGHNPCSCQGEVSLCVTLHIGVGGCHGRNQHVQQDHNHNEQEDEVQRDSKPPADSKESKTITCVALLEGWWPWCTVELTQQ